MVIFLIRCYQFIRPALDQVLLTAFGFKSECKHEESCSNYMVRQIREHGTIPGLRRGIARIASCHS